MPVSDLDILVGIATNLVSSALWDLFRDPLFRAPPDTADAAEHLEGARERFEAVVAEALDELTPLLEDVPSRERKRVAAFLDSAETRTIVADLYRTRLTARHLSLVELRQALATVWGVQHSGHHGTISAYDIFEALVSGSERVLESAIANQNLSAHEAMSAARHKDVTDRLDSLAEQTRTLRQASKPDIVTIEQFEHDLRKAVTRSHRLISPPTVRGAREVPIDDLFVEPFFTATTDETTLGLSEVTDQLRRLVVLGSPGAGKSTFARKLCYDLARRKTRIAGGLQPVPLFLELRTFIRSTENTPSSIREYLTAIASSSYQLDPPAHAFEYLLRAGRIGVVFDGLDELPLIDVRRQVRHAIEAFAAAYTHAPIVVTSRLIGYEHASLDEERFRAVRLADFTAPQVAEYARRWFNLDGGSRSKSPDATADASLVESETVPDLRANPLLLGLMWCPRIADRVTSPRNSRTLLVR